MLADKGALGELPAHVSIGEVHAQRGHVGAERVVRFDGAFHFLRLRRFDAGVHVVAPVAVGPAVEGAFLHRGQVIRHQVGAQFVPFVDHRPELVRIRVDGEGSGVAQAGGVGLVPAGLRVDLPDHGAVFLHVHAPFADVAVGADAHVEEFTVGAGGHRLGPVVVDLRRQVGDFLRRAAGPGLTLAVVEAHQGVLVGDIEGVVDQRQAVGGVEVIGEHFPGFVAAVAVVVAQQGEPVARLHRGGALLLDKARDHVLGAHGRRVAAAGAFRHQDVAVGQQQGLARNLHVLGDGFDLVAVRHRGLLIAPFGGRGNVHAGQQPAAGFGQRRVGAGLRRCRVATAGGQGGERGQREQRQRRN